MRYYPRHLLLQWHITDRCNLRCLHCYQDDAAPDKELSFQELLGILEQFRLFLHQRLTGFSKPRESLESVPMLRVIPGHITITGGEPFLRDDFPDLLKIFSVHKEEFSFAILTNGTRIDRSMAHKLRERGVSFVQVSIEGTESTHDYIRGKGNFKQVVAAIRHLVKAGVRTFVSFTAHKMNFHEFNEVAQLGRKLNVARVWADRLITQGRGSALHNEIMTPDETRKFFELMLQARRKAEHTWFNQTEISMHRALQFLTGGGKPYSCTAGNTLITIMPNGDLYPCRRMPIKVGNVTQNPLHELYECDLFQSLRNQEHIIKGCENCFYKKLCRGGLKCLSYALTGDPFQADPGCWRAMQDE